MVKRGENIKERQKRALKIYDLLGKQHPDAGCAINHRNAFEILVATVLSAQTTDIRVNQVTAELFVFFPDAFQIAKANEELVQKIIRPLGFYRAKTKSIINLASKLCSEFVGEVPSTLEQLVTLAGVGRKTANVVLGEYFGVPGLTVDTHEGRVARRLELAKAEDAVKVERELATVLPKAIWNNFNHRSIFHGRRVCHARKPACGACFVKDICPSFGIGPVDEKLAHDLVRPQATWAAKILPTSK